MSVRASSGIEWKNAGNEFMNSGQADKAVEAYSKAIELEPNNHLFYSNRSAAHVRMDNFEGALADGLKCTQLKPSWPKGYARYGYALYSLKRYEDALIQFEKGLVISPSDADLLNYAVDVKKYLWLKADAAKPSELSADDYKNVGIKHLNAGEVDNSITAFTKAIEMDSTNHVFYANRSAAYAAKSNFESALADGVKCTTMKASWGRGYARHGLALSGLERYDEALAVYEKGLVIAPSDAELSKLILDVKRLIEMNATQMSAADYKELGNKHVGAGLMDKAIDAYTKAISLDPSNHLYYSNRSAAYWKMNDFNNALTDALRCTQLNPTWPKGYGRYGQALVGLGQFDEAQAAYAKGLYFAPTDKDLLIYVADIKKQQWLQLSNLKSNLTAEEYKNLGNKHINAGENVQALASYTKAIELDPTNCVYYSNRSAAYLKINDINNALVDGWKCTQLNPTWSKSYVRYGQALTSLKRYDEALEAFGKGLIITPGDADLLKYIASARMLNMAKKSTMKITESAEDYKNMGNRHMNTGDVDQAIEAYTKSIKLDGNYVLFSNRSAAYLKKLDYSNAFVDALKCTQMNPAWAKGYIRCGLAFNGLGRYQDALTYFEKAQVLTPTDAELLKHIANVKRIGGVQTQKTTLTALDYKNMGNKYLNSNEVNLAIDAYGKAIDLEPTNHVFFSNRSAAYLKGGDYEKAASDGLRCVELSPEWTKGYTRYGVALSHMKRYEEALSVYEKGLTVDASDADLLSHLEEVRTVSGLYKSNMTAADYKEFGNKNVGAGLMDKAIDAYTKAIEMEPNNHIFYSNRSASYLKISDFNNALIDGLKCTQLEPAWAKGYARYGQALACLKQYDDALHAYEKGLSLAPADADLLLYVSDVKKLLWLQITPAKSGSKSANGSSDDFKSRGNAFMVDGDFAQAIDAYSHAIDLECSNHFYYSNRSVAYLKREDYANALADGYKCTKLSPVWPKGFARLGQALLGLQRNDEAFEVFEKGLSISPTDIDLLRYSNVAKNAAVSVKSPAKGNKTAEEYKHIGNKHLTNGDLELAIEAYSKSIRMEPQNHVYFAKRSVAYQKRGDLGNAFADGLRCVELNPTWTGAYATFGSVFCSLKRYHDALEIYAEGLSLSSTDSELIQLHTEAEKLHGPKTVNRNAEEQKNIGNKHVGLGEIDKALEAYTKAIAIESTNHLYYSNRSAAYLMKGDLSNALVDGLKCTHLNPTWFKGYVRYGLALSGLKRYEEAIMAYDQALKLNPGDADVLKLSQDVKQLLGSKITDSGASHLNSGNVDKAIDAYSKAIEMEPTNHIFYSNRSAAYATKGSYELALADSLECVRLKPSWVEGVSRHAYALIGLKRFEESFKVLEAGLVSFPNDSELLKGIMEFATIQNEKEKAYCSAEDFKNIGNKYMHDGEIVPAIEAYSRAIELEPSNPLYYSNRCAAYLTCDRYEDAAVDGLIITQLNPTWPKGYSRYGLALFELKRYEDALAAYEKGLRIAPTDPDLLKLFDELKQIPAYSDIRVNTEVLDHKDGNEQEMDDEWGKSWNEIGTRAAAAVDDEEEASEDEEEEDWKSKASDEDEDVANESNSKQSKKGVGNEADDGDFVLSSNLHKHELTVKTDMLSVSGGLESPQVFTPQTPLMSPLSVKNFNKKVPTIQDNWNDTGRHLLMKGVVFYKPTMKMLGGMGRKKVEIKLFGNDTKTIIIRNLEGKKAKARVVELEKMKKVHLYGTSKFSLITHANKEYMIYVGRRMTPAEFEMHKIWIEALKVAIQLAQPPAASK